MSITSAKTGATGISLALENNYMEPIASTLVGSGGVSTIEFLDIPQGYKHLQIRQIARTNRGLYIDFYKIKFNSDNGSNYAYHYIYGDGTSTFAGAVSSYTQIDVARTSAASANANGFGGGIVDILDYSNANKYKTTRAIAGYDDNGQGQIWFQSGLWMNNNPITNITINSGVGTLFSQYTRFSLYGIKG